MAIIRYMPAEALFARPLPRWKVAMDVAGASALLVLLSPVMAVIAIYIKVISPGPALFLQIRTGRLGRPFRMCKFRTMHVDTDTRLHEQYVRGFIEAEKIASVDGAAAPMVKLDNDPRVIPGGFLLRKLCLDELPQLLNVLKGEMSLIGPRPAIPYESDTYLLWHRARLDCRPGMTGLWQVSGKNNLSFREMVRLDIRYGRRLSFPRDSYILLKTFPSILAQFAEFLRKRRALQ